MIASVALHLCPVFGDALGERLRGARIYPMHVAEEIHDVFGATQQRQVSLDDNAVETVIYKDQEAFKELHEGFHRSSPQMFGWITKIIDHSDRWNQPPASMNTGIPLFGFSRAQPLAIFSRLWLERQLRARLPALPALGSPDFFGLFLLS